ncbi:MAG: GNAT family N-acetyltransferase [Patescibacteria group bacterium]|nr:GNAT family N-acetyltransferase [Patescibacteria group bacterium]MDE1965633.1 GNAT family N-acetyltransferase [Patescibacteria group bacterium]
MKPPTIREARADDLPEYSALLQRTYAMTYANDALGLPAELFSPEIFATADTQAYLAHNLRNTDDQRCWVAESDGKLVGAVTIRRKGVRECELTGFYVAPELQGHGIGKMLWTEALTFARDSDVTLDVYAHNAKAIELYKRWGFVEDTARSILPPLAGVAGGSAGAVPVHALSPRIMKKPPIRAVSS